MTTLNVNGELRTVDAAADMPLLWVLRDLIGLSGTSSAAASPNAAPVPDYVGGMLGRFELKANRRGY
jgi:isoquinoline 1-oxidoreductase alpha subunit